MSAPFIIFGLPRSRTAWLSRWLSAACGRPVGHDLAIQADTVEGLLGQIWQDYAGTVETGAIDGWRLLRRSLPQAPMVVVHRPLAGVQASLAALGLTAPAEQLEQREAEMQELSRQPGVLSVPFEALRYPQACAAIQAHCLPGLPFNWELWVEADRTNVQVEMPARVAVLAERAGAIARLKAEAAERTNSGRPWTLVAAELWADCAAECQAMGAAHHGEASAAFGDGVYRLDVAALARLEAAGGFRAITARVDSRLAGYCLWTNEINVEAVEAPAATQGPFYVDPAHAGLQLGRQLLARSRDVLAADGVQFLRLHHTTSGRGTRAGALYRRMGAVETKREYTLPIAGPVVIELKEAA